MDLTGVSTVAGASLPEVQYPPEMAEKYRKIRTVGHGAFGKALLVERVTDRRLFIAKELQVPQSNTMDRARVENEVEMLRQLQHPNIIRYIESYHGPDGVYIVMEYADGGDLYELLETRRQSNQLISEDEVLKIFGQICLGLQHVHKHRVIHRDIKSANVLLTATGMAKLGDFGFSTASASSVTLCGTPQYYSPEMCCDRPYSSKSDVWALGCVLYELMTLRMPFDGKDVDTIMRNIVTQNYVPPDSTQYSSNLRYLLSKLLAKEPSIRPGITTVLHSKVLQDHFKSLQPVLQEQTTRLTSARKSIAGALSLSQQMPIQEGSSSPPQDLSLPQDIVNRLEAHRNSNVPQEKEDSPMKADSPPGVTEEQRVQEAQEMEEEMDQILQMCGVSHLAAPSPNRNRSASPCTAANEYQHLLKEVESITQYVAGGDGEGEVVLEDALTPSRSGGYMTRSQENVSSPPPFAIPPSSEAPPTRTAPPPARPPGEKLTDAQIEALLQEEMEKLGA